VTCTLCLVEVLGLLVCEVSWKHQNLHTWCRSGALKQPILFSNDKPLGIVWMFNLEQGIGYSGVSSPEYHVSMCLAGLGIRATYLDVISRQRTEGQKNAQVMSRGYPGDWVCIRSALRLANKPCRSPRQSSRMRLKQNETSDRQRRRR
jgi:hypothetical protein